MLHQQEELWKHRNYRKSCTAAKLRLERNICFAHVLHMDSLTNCKIALISTRYTDLILISTAYPSNLELVRKSVAANVFWATDTEGTAKSVGETEQNTTPPRGGALSAVLAHFRVGT